MFKISTLIGSIFIAILALSCTQKNGSEIEFTLSNSGNLERIDEPIILSRALIKKKSGSIPKGKLPLPFFKDKPIASQVDDIDLDGYWDELAFLLNFSSSDSKKTVTIRFVDANEYPTFNQRTNVRFGILENKEVISVDELKIEAEELPVPLYTRFQMDGPAWENDKIGFRQYMDGRNGRDLYGKKLSSMALDTVGISKDGLLEDNYHVMLPWGRDILAVGNSLGLGGLAILENNVPVRLGVKMDAEKNNIAQTHYKLITEGPVRSIFKLNYNGWNTKSNTYNLENTVTIWAGKYGYTNDIKLESSNPTDTLLVGVVNINNDTEPVLLDKGKTISAFYTHDKQTYNDEWYLGMGIVFPNSQFLGYNEAPESGDGITTSYLTQFELSSIKTLTYHVFAGWEISDERFSDTTFFNNLIESEISYLEHPIIIE